VEVADRKLLDRAPRVASLYQAVRHSRAAVDQHEFAA
jgi:hypothetical protein